MSNQSLEHEILTGAELVARAAIRAGVNFFAGYPITPASSVYSAMLNKLQAEGKLAIGCSDEISAISMCIGASLRGAKSMTATSAPGLSLMIENIGYAFATETPCLIVLGQRLGPSTGAATQSAQGDISFIKNLISGGFEIPVFAPNSIFDSYKTCIDAINCSELLRCPVILCSEKDILMSFTNISLEALSELDDGLEIVNRPYRNFDDTRPYKTYGFNKLEEIPEFLAAGIGSKERVVVTASSHNKAGELSKLSPESEEVFLHYRAKLEKNLDKFLSYDFDEELGSDTLIISFMSNSMSSKAAVNESRLLNKKVSHLSLKTLFPIPEYFLKEIIKPYKRIVIPEINETGQYADLIKYLFEGKELIKLNSIAKAINPKDILEVIL
jgi:2-oxoglutarate/2-oxoacid ferredoxin oxidoreductase subunit alpha